jgi:ribosomal protein S18 acetylase RimI-like enzyme
MTKKRNNNYRFKSFNINNEKDIALIREFYYSNPSTFVSVSGESDFAFDMAGYFYYGLLDPVTKKPVAMSAVENLTPNLAYIWSTLVHKDYKRQGLGTRLSKSLSSRLKREGYGKLSSYVYTNNLPNVLLKIKLGWVIEARLKDHDSIGQDEYLMSKYL